MRIDLICHECNKTSGRIRKFYSVLVTDDGRYQITCDEGHTTTHYVEDRRYILLAESAASSLYHGYPRESVASFAAALERFYEDCIEQFIRETSIDSELFADGWKGIAKQTERQLGAFRMLYLLCLKTKAPEIPQKWVEFRNDIVHKGEFPTEEKTIEYGQLIINHICQIQAAMYEKYCEIHAVISQEREIIRNKGDYLNCTVQGINSLLFPGNPISLIDWLKRHKQSDEDRKKRHEEEIVFNGIVEVAQRIHQQKK